MTKRDEWVIEVWLKRNKDEQDRQFKMCGVDLLVTELLRYAGITRVIEDSHDWLKFIIRRAGERGTEQWATMNAERIRSFVISAQPVQERR